MSTITRVDANSLYVSEPNPSWFGNGPNEQNNPKWTNANWLKSRFHFSFAEYHDAKRCVFTAFYACAIARVVFEYGKLCA